MSAITIQLYMPYQFSLQAVLVFNAVELSMNKMTTVRKYRAVCVLITSLFLSFNSAVLAKEKSKPTNIQAVALFNDMVVVNFNNQQTTLRVGQTKHNELQLLESNSEQAVILYHGQKVKLTLTDSSVIQLAGLHNYDARAHLISNGGLYNIAGSIDNQMVDFVVDTGASYLTMSMNQADKLHINYIAGRQIDMSTANGNTQAYVVTLKKVRIGGIEVENIEAAIIANESSSKILLGMSFLKHVDMEQRGNTMVLKPRI